MGRLTVCRHSYHRHSSARIVDDLDLGRTGLRPLEAAPILVIDADAVLSLPVTPKGPQSISKGDSQVLQKFCRI
jgi:hypothetical protein